ncbi:MAG: hypothetical protein ACR2PZ_09880 [Pseudomonadales bacterium]
MESSTYIHVGAATLALVAGAVALCARKGAKAHKQSGYVFVASMIVMAIPAGLVSYTTGKPFDVLSSILTCYMVLTGLLAFRMSAKRASIALMSLAGLCISGYVAVEIGTIVTDVRDTDAPVGAGYVFATILGLALWGDFRGLSQSLSPQQVRIRHLWRMSFGLFMATGNLFGVRPHLFPDWMQDSGVLVLLAIAPLLVMVYWRFRLRPQTLTDV